MISDKFDDTDFGNKKNVAALFSNAWKNIVYAFKDLKTQKVRTFFGIGGIAISIFLIQVVGVLTDSLSYSYLEASATNTGAADFMITKNLDFSGSFNPYMNQTEIQEILDGIEEIESAVPRLLLLPLADVVNPNLTLEPQNKTIFLYGIDVPAEKEAGIGTFRFENGSEFVDAIPDGYCVISPYISETLHVGVGDDVTIRFATFPAVNLTVLAIVEQEQKFLSIEIDTICTNLEWVQNQFDLQGRVNYFEAMVRNRYSIYDTRNIGGTIDKMRRIGEKVQVALGDDYTVNMLKLQDLEQSETMNIAMSVAFIFISIISMIIAAILINSILSTAVEERIREFGVFRVLGARKSFPFVLIILQGLLMSIIGATVGVILGTWFAQLALPILYDWLGLWTKPIPLVVQPTTIFLSMGIGIGITLLVTAFPAYKAATKKIVQAINPYRNRNEGWKQKKEGSINGKLISSGIAAVVAGSLVFYLIPQIALTGDIMVLMVAFLGVQLAFLIGLTLVSLGFIPGLEMLVWYVFRIFNRKTTPVVKTSLRRYRRRNTSTVLMFSMTFAFILFISTTLELMMVQQTYLVKAQYGSDLAVYSTDVRNQIDENLMRNVAKYPGVEMVSGVYTDALDIAAAILYLREVGISDIDFGRAFDSPRYSVEISDLIEYYSYSANLVAIDRNYTKMMDESLFRVNGGKETVEKLFYEGDPAEDPNNIIVAKAVADAAQLKVGDNVRLTFYESSGGGFFGTGGRGAMIKIINATIIGLSDGMPGFWQFRQARIASFLGGVMCSREHYIDWMDLNGTNLPLSKIFVNVEPGTDLDALRNEIERDFDGELKAPNENGEQAPYDFAVEHQQSRIDEIVEGLQTTSLLFQTILSFTILIALFGLMSSVYSTIIERKREIGVLKAIGLKNNQTRNLFIMESVILLLASSVGGALIGITSSIVNAYEQTSISEIPVSVLTNIANIPWDVVFQSFFLAIGVCLVGMLLLLRRIAHMEVMEIFRETM